MVTTCGMPLAHLGDRTPGNVPMDNSAPRKGASEARLDEPHNMVSHQANQIRVRPECRYLDQHEAPRLLERIRHELNGGMQMLVLDLSDIRFLDSSGMAMLVALRRLRPTREDMILEGLTPSVAQQLRLSRQLRLVLEGEPKPTPDKGNGHSREAA